MNSNKQFILIIAGFLMLAIINLVAWKFPQPPRSVSVPSNASGSLAAEDYNPYIMYNGGYYSAKPIQTTSTLTVGGAASFTSTLTLGSSGTAVSQIIKGTCNLLGMDTAQPASTTVPYDCAVTGVVSGDVVFAAPSATTTATYTSGNPPFFIVGAKASTTSGFITFGVWNAGGSSKVPSAPGGGQGIGSSTPYLIVR